MRIGLACCAFISSPRLPKHNPLAQHERCRDRACTIPRSKWSRRRGSGDLAANETRVRLNHQAREHALPQRRRYPLDPNQKKTAPRGAASFYARTLSIKKAAEWAWRCRVCVTVASPDGYWCRGAEWPSRDGRSRYSTARCPRSVRYLRARPRKFSRPP